MQMTWIVERQPEGGFLLWVEGTEPRIAARDLAQLKTQGHPNGIVDEIYDDVCRQLEHGDRATVKVPIFKFSQVDVIDV